MKTAIIGAGYIGKVHLSVLKSLPGITGIGLADTNYEEVKELSRLHNLEEPAKDYRELLDDPELTTVHVCTPNHLHSRVIRDALDAGKHVLAEKPLCLHSDEAEELCRIAEGKRLVTGVNFCYRYYPAIQEAAARIADGSLGRIAAVNGHFFQDWLLKDTDYSWRLDPRFSGDSNAMADIGSHWCDLIRFLTGSSIRRLAAHRHSVHPVRRKPRGSVRTFDGSESEEYDEVNISLEDYGSVMFEMDDGSVGAFSVCQACAGHKVDLEVQIFGTESSLSWSHRRPERLLMGYRDEENRVFLENPRQQDERTAGFARLPSGHPMGYHDAVFNMFFEFYSQVATGQPIHRGCPNFRDGLEQLRITESAVRSDREQRWVDVTRNP